MPPQLGNRFALAGRSWEVLDIDIKRKAVFVKQVDGSASISWQGSSCRIHTKILKRIRKVLIENSQYPYLQSQAKERLKTARQLAKMEGLAQKNILCLDEKICCVFPWMGTVAYRTLERLLNFCVRGSLGIRSIKGKSPYYLIIKLEHDKVEELRQEILDLCNQGLTEDDLVAADEAPKLQKYDEFIPNNLLRKAFALDYLDVAELRQLLDNW
ncbi:MAG: hypothetical protein F6K28_61750 [Microcoleus sp. SIO2G3]|nr:hypothetical protein [Microcoleus sp. SIO2G3]